METLKRFFKNIFTEADNATFCLVRAMVGTGGVAMIGKFIAAGTADFQAIGVGLAALCAAVAAKNATDKVPPP